MSDPFGDLFKLCHFRLCEPFDIAQGKLHEATHDYVDLRLLRQKFVLSQAEGTPRNDGNTIDFHSHR